MTHPLPDTDTLLDVAGRCADAARAPALRWFRRPDLAAEDKGAGRGRFDPVTEADRGAEAAIRTVLAGLRPDDAVEGEEQAATEGRSGIVWVVDPIDGTRSYLSGSPVWGVLVAAQDADGPMVGVIDQPFTGERFLGVARGGLRRALWRRGTEERAIAVRPCAGLADATLFTTFPEVGTEAERAGFAAVAGRARLVRYGLDCYAYALLAMGCIDVVIEAGLHPYDIAAPIAVIEGAGGLVTDWRGGPAHRGGRILAAGDPRVHAEALAILSAVP